MDPIHHQLDQRTRSDAETRSLDFETFCRDELPALLERNGELAGRGAAAWELRPPHGLGEISRRTNFYSRRRFVDWS